LPCRLAVSRQADGELNLGAWQVISAMIILLTGTLLSFANISPNWQLSFQGAILILVLSVRRLLEKRNGF